MEGRLLVSTFVCTGLAYAALPHERSGLGAAHTFLRMQAVQLPTPRPKARRHRTNLAGSPTNLAEIRSNAVNLGGGRATFDIVGQPRQKLAVVTQFGPISASRNRPTLTVSGPISIDVGSTLTQSVRIWPEIDYGHS